LKSGKNRYLLTSNLLLVLGTLVACSTLSTVRSQNSPIPQPIAPKVLTSSQTPIQNVEPSPTSESMEARMEDCADAEVNAIAESIAVTYEMPVQTVVEWYCEGHAFEDILIALETGLVVDISADDLLKMRLEQDWESIWVNIGFTNHQ